MDSQACTSSGLNFSSGAIKIGYAKFIAARPPARCPYDSELFRSIAIRNLELTRSQQQEEQQQEQQQIDQPEREPTEQLDSSSCSGRRGQSRRRRQLTDRLSGESASGSGGPARRQSSSRSAMLVRRSLLLRQQSLSQAMPAAASQSSQSSQLAEPLTRRMSTASSLQPPRSPCFTSRDQLIDQLRQLLLTGEQRRCSGVNEECEALFVIGTGVSSESSRLAGVGGGSLADSAQAIADCLLGLPLSEGEASGRNSLVAFALQCLDEVQPDANADDDDKWTLSQLKVYSLLMTLDQAIGSNGIIGDDDFSSLVKWSLGQLRRYLFFPDGRVAAFLSDKLAPVWPPGSVLARLVREIRLEMALPVSDDENEDEDADCDGDLERRVDADLSRDMTCGSGLLDATIEDANAEFPDLSAAPAIPAFYCGVEPPILCDSGRMVGGVGGGSLPRCGSASVLRGMTNQRQLFVPAATVSATSVVGSGRLPSSKSAAAAFALAGGSAPMKTPSPGAKAQSRQRRRTRIRVLETPTPKRSRLRLQRLASERTRHCPIVIGESPPGSPTSPSPSASLLMLRAAAAADFDKENQQQQQQQLTCRAALLADAWVQRQRDREAELASSSFDVINCDFDSQQASQQSTASGVSTNSACRRISFPRPQQQQDGSSGSQLIRRASQLFANLVSP